MTTLPIEREDIDELEEACAIVEWTSSSDTMKIQSETSSQRT